MLTQFTSTNCSHEWDIMHSESPALQSLGR
jgi:hypothetical protein